MQDLHFQGFYRRFAKIYNFYFGKTMNPGRLKAIEAAELKSGEKVLEVGVGTGLSLPFYPENVEVTGIDLSQPMLERAQALVTEEQLSHVKSLQLMNAEEMSFSDNSFDCVMAMHVSTVVGDVAKFAAEMRRVCRPGGRIVIVNYFHDPKTAVGQVSKIVAPYVGLLGWRPDLTLEDFLKRTGFKVKAAYPVNFLSLHSVFLIPNPKPSAN